MQLNEVFTNSANGDNEQANLEVAAEIRKMQQIQMDQMKALKDIPFELIEILRKQSSKARSSLADCEDDGRTLMNSNSNSRKSMHRSKSRKANKVASGNNERKEKG